MAVKKRDLYLDIRKNVPAKERKRLGITAKTPKKRLMEIIEAEKMTGSGIFDFITKPIGKFFGPREDFNNISTKTLKEYGDAPIQSMYIMRAPITGAINTALNIVSLGAWNRVRKEANYDRLFHLSLVCDVRKDNQVVPIILEKNEVVHISSSFKKYPGFETMPIPLPQGTAQSDYSTKVRRAGPPKVLTIRQLVENALKGVGRKTFFEYDAFNNNCQFFIMYLLQYSGLLSAKAKGFIYQPMEEVVKKIPGFVPKMARMLTDLAASWNKLSGQGKEGEEMESDEEEEDECEMMGGQIGFSPAGISKGSKNRITQQEKDARETLITFILDGMFEAGEISGKDLRNAKVDARNLSRKKAEERVDQLKAQNPDKTFEQIRKEALARYEQTERGKMEKAQREAEAEASAERIGQEIRAREQAKFQKENPFLSSIVDFGRVTAPITTEALKYVLSAVPGLPPQVRDGLNKGLNLMRNIATRDDVREGRLDIMGEVGKVLGEGAYGGQRQNAQGIMKQLKAYALGDNDVQEKLPTDTKIILYNDLAGVEDITELMDEKGRLVMLYPREAPTVGHWVCMFINKEGDIEYFDPYGEPPEETKRDLSPEKLEELGIVEDILMPLLKQSASKRGKGVVFNAHQYQKLAPGINTCGRWCVSRLAFHEATADEFKKILDEMKKGTNKSYDDIVSILTEI